jgi:hypothetical protein
MGAERAQSGITACSAGRLPHLVGRGECPLWHPTCGNDDERHRRPLSSVARYICGVVPHLLLTEDISSSSTTQRTCDQMVKDM